MKKILVIGSGGREHAVCEQFKKSPQEIKIFALPGNAGIAAIAEIVDSIKQNEHQKIIDFCQREKINFVFVGPEQPLVEGLVDDLEKNKIRVFGPSKFAAQLEGSKIFMKKIADENGVPTAAYETFLDEKSAAEFAKKLGFPCVVKADGLAAGKGVIIPQNLQEAEIAIKEILSGKFGEAGKKIIIEEFLDGFEASYFVLCDGKNFIPNFIPLGFAHDHKKVGENETGPNTGGMGTFAPSPFIDAEMEKKIIAEIITPTLRGLENAGAPFRGILFAGLMIGKNGPKLLEFNVRFGDPETQVILPRIKSDFVALIEAAIDGNLDQFQIEFDAEKKLVCVVMCANGYPENYEKGSEIKGLEEAAKIPNVKILHAGTIKKDGKILANGGRVLNIVAESDSFKSARDKAYKAIDLIDWATGFCRNDIAKKAVGIKAAVIGDPISHSLSPKIHNFFLEKYKIDGSYEALQVTKNNLSEAVAKLVDSGFAGFNVTLPHKEEIFKICDYKSKTAELTGAVNTVIITPDKKLFGHNSDAEGFLNNLKNSQPDFDLNGKNVFVIGAGGAARAVVYALIKSDVKNIFITNRSELRTTELIKNFADFAQQKKCELKFLDKKKFEKNLNQCDLLVNSTPLGMLGQAVLELDLKNLKKSALVYDIVYKPLMTELLKTAEARGNQILTGIGMLVFQALVGFEAWFKQKPEIDKKLFEILFNQNS